MSRKTFIGLLHVFREGPISETLSATVDSEENHFFYHPCPVSFQRLTTGDNPVNNVRISFTANDDGNGTNPRSVTVL